MCLHLLSTTATTGTLTRSGARSRSRVGESNRRSVLYPWINHFFNNYWRSPTPDNDTTTSPSRRSFSVRTGTLESLPLSLLSPLRGILNFETKSSHRSCTLRTMMRSYPSHHRVEVQPGAILDGCRDKRRGGQRTFRVCRQCNWIQGLNKNNLFTKFVYSLLQNFSSCPNTRA